MSTDAAATSIDTTLVTPSECRHALKRAFRTQRTLAVWGHIGIAKSAVLKALAQEMGVAMIDFRLSQFVPEDLRGIPMPSHKHGYSGMVWNPPEDMPRDLDFTFVIDVEAEEDTPVSFYNPRSHVNKIFYCTDPEIKVRPFDPSHTYRVRPVLDDKGAVLHDRFLLELRDADNKPVAGRVRIYVKGKTRGIWGLEEFNSADMSVQAACYELLLDRRLGGYSVPDGVHIVATGNLDEDGGMTYRLLRPVANRMLHMQMTVSHPDWFEWAEGIIHPMVYAFLQANPASLFDAQAHPKQKAFATPRSWEMFSEVLLANPDMSESERLTHGSAAVGARIARIFNIHYAAFTSGKGIVTVEEVLSGAKLRVVPPRDQDRTYFQSYLAQQICFVLRGEAEALKANPDYHRADKLVAEKERFMERMRNFLRWVDQSVPSRESRIVIMRMAVRRFMLPFGSRWPEFAQFAEELGQFIIPDDDDDD